MKIVTLIARNLLGLMFLVFGLNGFLHFIPQPPPTGLAAQYLGALSMSHMMVAVFLLQVIGGALLLVNWFVPIALVVLGPVMGIVFYAVRPAFAGVFAMRGTA